MIITATATAQNYSRSEFGPWIDSDGDCQDTRQEILIRDSYFTPSGECKVSYGFWFLPYRGSWTTNPSIIDIDHIIPLRLAWDLGANDWTREERVEFANDPQNLLAVSASENRSKGARGPDQWLPKNMDFWCEYIERWKALKLKYNLRNTIKDVTVVTVITKTCKRIVDT